MKRIFVVLLTALLAGAPALAVAAPKRRSKSPSAASIGGKDKSVHKARLESNLQKRLKKIDQQDKVRGGFFAKEGEAWKAFWARVKKERTLFEVRMARQALALLDSLSSLDKKSHAAALSNFEKLRAEVVRTFESQQRKDMSEFFEQREARWARFAREQEGARADFAAEAQIAWEEEKARIRGRKVRRREPRGEPVVESPVKEPEPAARKRPSRSGHPLKMKGSKSVTDGWH